MRIIRKLQILNNKEAMFIDEDDEREIFENGFKKSGMFVLMSKTKTFGVLEIELGEKLYYMVRDDITGVLLLIRDDDEEIKDIFMEVINRIKEKLKERNLLDIDFVKLRDDNLIFSNSTKHIKEKHSVVYSAIEVDDEIFPIKVVKGKKSGKINVFVNMSDFEPYVMRRVMKKYKLVGKDQYALITE